MEKFFPFDSVQGDRVYKSNDWVEYYKNFITDGLIHNNGKVGLNLISITNFALKISTGGAFIGGRQYILSEDIDIVFDIPESNMYRKDLLVLRCDTRLHERSIKLTILKGEPAISEEAAKLPEIERSEYIYDLGLYSILTKPQAEQINLSDVKDLRGDKNYCQLSNPKGFGGSSIFRGSKEPNNQFVKAGDIWMDELEE